MLQLMDVIEEPEDDSDKRLSMVDEALVAGTIANTNGLLVILAKLVAKGVFDRADLQSFSDSYSKPLDHVRQARFERQPSDGPTVIGDAPVTVDCAKGEKPLACFVDCRSRWRIEEGEPARIGFAPQDRA